MPEETVGKSEQPDFADVEDIDEVDEFDAMDDLDEFDPDESITPEPLGDDGPNTREAFEDPDDEQLLEEA